MSITTLPHLALHLLPPVSGAPPSYLSSSTRLQHVRGIPPDNLQASLLEFFLMEMSLNHMKIERKELEN